MEVPVLEPTINHELLEDVTAHTRETPVVETVNTLFVEPLTGRTSGAFKTQVGVPDATAVTEAALQPLTSVPVTL